MAGHATHSQQGKSTAFRLPDTLQSDDDQAALRASEAVLGDGVRGYTGAEFDTWYSTGTADADRNRQTADDIAALSFLYVAIPGRAAQGLIRDRAGEFTELHTALGDDRDLVDERDPSSTMTGAGGTS